MSRGRQEGRALTSGSSADASCVNPLYPGPLEVDMEKVKEAQQALIAEQPRKAREVRDLAHTPPGTPPGAADAKGEGSGQ